MSATRIVRRVAWAEAHPRSRRGYRIPYHGYLTTVGLRHVTFQRKIRATRLAMGLAPTTTDMHHVHGEKL